MSEDGFHPDQIILPQGGIIRFLNSDDKPRWPASDPHPTHELLTGFDPRRGIVPGDFFEFTFSQPREWHYHDHLSPHRRGTVLVSPDKTQTQQQETSFLNGVFMENIFGVHESKPSANRMVKADDPYYPCNAVAEKYRGGCWANQATLMFQLFSGNLHEVAEACDSVAEAKYKTTCYNNFARQIHSLTEGKTAKAVTLCDAATGAWKDDCLLTLVSSAFSVGDRKKMPYEICAFMSLHGSPQQNACYERLFQLIASYSKTPDTAHVFCESVQEIPRRNECLKKFGLPPETNKIAPFSEKNEGDSALAPNYQDIQALIEKNGVKAAYQYIIQKWGADPIAAHDLAHLIGRAAYKELGTKSFSVCDSNFAFGCYHGLLEEMLRDKGQSAIKIAQDTCNGLSLQGQVVSCLHGTGHGILVWKNMDLKSALQVCDAFTAQEKPYCFDGSFMEFYSSAMEQGKKIEISSENPWKFCTELLPQFQAQCVRNHTFFLLRSGTLQTNSALPPCGDLSSQLKPDCVRSVGFFVTQIARGSIDASKKTCRGFKNEDDYSLCVVSASQEFIFEGLPETAVRPLCQGLNDVWGETAWRVLLK